MILEYIWIEDYGVIKDQGFNFNPNVSYFFNKETGELHKEMHDCIPSNFFNIRNDTVIGISALVGANGTGKSTVLEFISSFLTFSHPLGGFVITDKYIINKSENSIRISKTWLGQKPSILTRLELINNYRIESNYKPITKKHDTKNNPLGLKILENLIKDTRLIYYSGEFNFEHTNRTYQNLLNMSDEFENSHYTDISDMALMANDQRKYRTDKAVYSGENPILAYRSGESQRFIELMVSDYRSLIPFSLESLNIGFSFSDNDRTFFESYDEMAFSTIGELLLIILKRLESEMPPKTVELLEKIKMFGLGGYFNNKLFKHEKDFPQQNLKVHLYHHLLLRHLREQLMETMGELTEKEKLNLFLTLLSEIENCFLTKKSYIDQIKAFFKKTKFAAEHTGSLKLESVESFYEKIHSLNLWEYGKFRMSLSDMEIINKMLKQLTYFDKESGLKYGVSTIFDLDIRGLSTGEKQFIKLFSRFLKFNLNNEGNSFKEKHFIILIDEFDIGFHPLWQRKFLSTWIEFLEGFINKSTKNAIQVQLILTSHSPFVVSDLPKQSINFLSKKEGEKYSRVDVLSEHQATFGANIHELYSDSFFLTGALMGDFAKAKIDEAFKLLSGDTILPESNTIKSLIKIIGEPILRAKLSEMYAEKIGENVELARLKMQQEYIIHRLKEIENNGSN